ncbi:Arm DNA-binding domain-containing protein [Pantoea ananatis]|nr:Arm DNA-binding domain-containing protein [Pantoea ananatis]
MAKGLALSVLTQRKSSMFALGEYPTVKLAEAREKCEQARKLVADDV